MASSPHVFPLADSAPVYDGPFGSIRSADSASFAIVDRLSLRKMALEPECVREPHWHANAHEMGYLVEGALRLTVFESANVKSRFAVAPGQMWFAPSGSLHSIENIGAGTADMVVAFSASDVEDFGLSGSIGAMSRQVMANTWASSTEDVRDITRSHEDIVMGRAGASAEIDEADRVASRLRFDVEAMSPPIVNEYGSARTAKRTFWPVLRDLSMFSLRIAGDGMREPHWHPETAEMGYVLSGRARMTVRSPGAEVDTYLLAPGDAYFIPRAYPHHIENLDDTETRFLVFFDQAEGQDIGYTGGTAAMPRRTMGPTLGVDAGRLPQIPDVTGDLLLVRKRDGDTTADDA